jgi:hypothetical protein
MSTEANLPASLGDYMTARIRGLRVRIAVLASLILVAAIYLAIVLKMVTDITPTQVVRFVAGEVESRLPSMQVQLQQQAIAVAPDALTLAEKYLISLPAELRQRTELRVKRAFRERMPTYQEDLNRLLERAINDGLADLDRVDPGASREQQVASLIAGILGRVEQDLGTYLAQVGLAYQQDLEEFNGYLRQLSEGRNLGERQRLERDLIQATIALYGRNAGH